MINYTQRFYRDEADYAAMRRLIADSYRLVAPHSYLLLGDLDWWRALQAEPEAYMATVPLWFAGDALVGFLWPGEGNAEIMLHPQHRGAEPSMLAWAEAHQPHAQDPGAPCSLVQASLASDVVRNGLLAEHGFARTDEFLASHVLDLEQPPPQPQLAAGFTIRDMAGEVAWDGRVAVHRAAFAPSKFTLAKYQRVRQSPTYRPDLDLVAIAPDGDFAAFCILWFEPENRVALFEPVGCHPDYQRRGLGLALLREGSRRLHELGAVRAHVCSWMDDSAGAHLYRAAGFHMIDRFYEWRKTYGPDAGQS